MRRQGRGRMVGERNLQMSVLCLSHGLVIHGFAVQRIVFEL